MRLFGRCGTFLVLSLLVALLCKPVQAQTAKFPASETQNVITVDSAVALARALAAAMPGTVILLAAGDYGPLILTHTGGAVGNPVTLRSADTAKPARFSTMTLHNVSHLVLDSLTFNYRFSPTDKPYLRPFEVIGSQDITIRHSLFDGDLTKGVSAMDDGYPTGFGLSLRGVAGAVLEENEISNFYRGLVVSDSSDLVIRANDVHTIRSDGMDFAQVVRLSIEANHIHDFKRAVDSPDHADMIQFWTNGTTTPSTDITIAGNILNSGSGAFTHSIFIRNERVDSGKAGPEMFYRNITIRDNVIINAHLHGITVGETAGLVIKNNTLIHNAASQGQSGNLGLWTPQIRVAPTSTAVVITRNVTSAITGYTKQAGWTVTDNAIIQDSAPSRANFYNKIFVAAQSGDPDDLNSFTYLPGGPLDGAGLGAPQLDPAAPRLATDTAAHPMIRVTPDANQSNRFHLDASASLLPKGVEANQVTFLWTLDDGATLSGAVIDHSFLTTGTHQIGLAMRLSDGSQTQSHGTVTVADPCVLEFSSDTGDFSDCTDGTAAKLSLGRGTAVLGQGAALITIAQAAIAPFFQAHDFELHLKLHGAGDYKSAGELLRIHQSLLVNVTGRGTLDVSFDTAETKLHLITRPVALFSSTSSNPDWHDIGFRYSALDGIFTVTADGKVIGQGKASGLTRPMGHWGLTLGNPFGKKSFDGSLDSLSLRVNQQGFSN